MSNFSHRAVMRHNSQQEVWPAMKKSWKSVLFVVLNLLLLSTLLLSFYVYTVAFPFTPWHDLGTMGFEFLFLFFFVFPILLVTGIFLFILGRFFHISRLNKWLPFIALAGLLLPTAFIPMLRAPLMPIAMILPGNEVIASLVGAFIAAMLCLLVLATAVTNLTSQRNK